MGHMETSLLKDLLGNLSFFNQLCSTKNKESLPTTICYQSIAESLTLLRPVLNEIIDSELPLDELLTQKLEELDMFVDDAKKLMKGWHPLMSKIFNIIQIEMVAGKIQLSVQAICTISSSLSLSAPSASNVVLIKKHGYTSESLISSVIRESINNQREGILPSRDAMMKIADSMSLSSSQELLMEAVALEKAKVEAQHESKTEEVKLIDEIITLVSYMHDSLLKIKQSQTVDGVPIPADFCCPLSLEPMSDPVIVASGQTYERAFIRKWLDLGLTVCPKTRQNLSHTNLIPNFTVKALIANWCELNNVKLPDPVKAMNSSQPLLLLGRGDSSGTCTHFPRSSRALASGKIASSTDQIPSNGNSEEAYSDGNQSFGSEPHNDCDGSFKGGMSSRGPSNMENGSGKGMCGTSSVSNESGTFNSTTLNVNSVSPSLILAENDPACGSFPDEQVSDTWSTSMYNSVSSTDVQKEDGNVNETSASNANENASGEVISKDPASSTPPRDAGPPIRLLEIRRTQPLWRRSSDRSFGPRIISDVLHSKSNLSEIDAQVKKLVEDLQSTSPDVQRSAAVELRHLTRHSMENRIVIANSGAIKLLVDLLCSTDVETQDNAVTALLNLSINDNNKNAIANAEAIEPLIHVLKTGSAEAKENSAATLFSLSVIEENKVKIGRSGAIQALVELLGIGTPRGKKDAATALFNLSIFHENKVRIVQAGAVKYLVDLTDPAAGMVDKAVAVLSNLSTISEGRNAIGQEGGIPALVEVVELGSSRGKENAAATLLQLCLHSTRFTHMVLQEGVVPPLVALSQSGTARAKEKILDSLALCLDPNSISGLASRKRGEVPMSNPIHVGDFPFIWFQRINFTMNKHRRFLTISKISGTPIQGGPDFYVELMPIAWSPENRYYIR